jgi:hypothetical protein
VSGQPYVGTLEAVDRILNREADADEALRQIVAEIHRRIGHYASVDLFFLEDGRPVPGPSEGSAGAVALEVPVVYRGSQVAGLRIGSDSPAAFSDDDREFLARVALLISAHCLVAWDTGGVPWSDVR